MPALGIWAGALQQGYSQYRALTVAGLNPDLGLFNLVIAYNTIGFGPKGLAPFVKAK